MGTDGEKEPVDIHLWSTRRLNPNREHSDASYLKTILPLVGYFQSVGSDLFGGCMTFSEGSSEIMGKHRYLHSDS